MFNKLAKPMDGNNGNNTGNNNGGCENGG